MTPLTARRSVVAMLALLAATASAHAQTRYAVEPRASLAWWQINPHFNHLWATSCPADPSWQPGEGRSPGYYVDYLTRHKTLDSGRKDDRIPLYPRHRIRYVCRQAVIGYVDVRDTANWSVAGGLVSVTLDSLVTGLDMRDSFARRSVFQTDQYPSVRFSIDSLTNRQMAGDTLVAHAVGTFELRGVRKVMSAPVRAWPEGGGMRVQTRMQIPAKSLTSEWGMSKAALGMGVALSQWQEVHMGIDVLLMKAKSQPSGTE